MNAKWLPALAVGLSMGILACEGSVPGPPGGTGGVASGGASTGGSASGGAASGGAASGSGGVASGGQASGGQASGGAAAGGSSSGGSAATGGSDSSGGNGSGGGLGDVSPSDGCTVTGGAETLTAGGSSVSGGLPTSTRLSIQSGGSSRDYIIDIPADYDPTHPYRLIFSWHQAYGSANGNAVGQYPANSGPNFDAEHYAYFGLHREAQAAGEPAIFVAPQGIGDFPWDYDRDVVLFDALLTAVTANLCIDESRVFTTGFSFGAMMSHALSLGRASKLRGAVTMAPANYHFTQPTKEDASVAYFGITGMSDGTCKWINSDQAQEGGKYCVLTHAEDNGCAASVELPTAAGGSKGHVCYDFEGCAAGYPVKVCTFDGAHTPSSVSDGVSGGDDGLNAFVPPLAWEFISSL
jgi:poly(3-hydroxybutyrate) depolymerase